MAGIAWWLFAPAATPLCDDPQVQKTIRISLFSAYNQERIRNPLTAGAASADALNARFSDIKEIGYIKAERSRGCTATLKAGDASATMAYTIGPNENGDILVQGADPRIVRTRYGQVDKNGKVIDMGQPAGAARLTAAFQEAVDDYDRQPQNLARQARREREQQRRGLPPEADPRSVRSIMPLGNCKQTAPSLWSCRMQAEYRDRLLSAIGRSDWQVLEGDFDFVQHGNVWRVSDEFPRQYLYSIVRGRVDEMVGSEAAAKLEAGLREREADRREAEKRETETPGAPHAASESAPRPAQAPARPAELPPIRGGRSDGGVVNF